MLRVQPFDALTVNKLHALRLRPRVPLGPSGLRCTWAWDRFLVTDYRCGGCEATREQPCYC